MITKLLVWSDYCTSTGFSTVMSNILRRLPESEFELDIVGVNYQGNPDYDHRLFPGRVWPALSSIVKPYNDFFGRQKIIDQAIAGNYDKIFILQDLRLAAEVIPKLVEARDKHRKWYEIVYYFPVDSPPRVWWVNDSIGLVDKAIAYTEYGKIAVQAALPGVDIEVIYHGTDTSVFHPSDNQQVKEYRAFYAPGTRDKFLLGNINRNQPRKDIARSLQVLHELKRIGHKDFALYLHMSKEDIGGDFTPIAAQLGLKQQEDYFLPQDFPSDGVTQFELNMIYNMCDALITTTLGEGWGLSLTEAMATKLPVIAPAHTSISEILGVRNLSCAALTAERGYPVRAGNITSLWTTIAGDTPVLRPQVQVEHMVEQILLCRKQKDSGINKILTEQAFEWVRQYSWEILKWRWEEILHAENNSKPKKK